MFTFLRIFQTFQGYYTITTPTNNGNAVYACSDLSHCLLLLVSLPGQIEIVHPILSSSSLPSFSIYCKLVSVSTMSPKLQWLESLMTSLMLNPRHPWLSSCLTSWHPSFFFLKTSCHGFSDRCPSWFSSNLYVCYF